MDKLNFLVVVVARHSREIPAHSAIHEHKHRGQTQGGNRHDRHQGSGPPILQHCPQEGRYRSEQEGRRMHR